MQALQRWELTLDAILAGRRRRLRGPEYIALMEAIDRAGDESELRAIALRLAKKLSQHDGLVGQARFLDPVLAQVYESQRKPEPIAGGPATNPVGRSQTCIEGAAVTPRSRRPRPA